MLTARCNLCDVSVTEWVDSPEGRTKCPHCRSVARHRAVALLLDQRGLCQRAPALDLGGDGCMFRGRLPSLLSVDMSYDGAHLRGDIERLPIRTGIVALVLCLDVLEHVRNDAAGAREIERVLRPDGSAIVTASCWGPRGRSRTPAEAGLAERHLDMAGEWTSWCYRYYTNESVIDLLRGAGLHATHLRCKDVRFMIDGVDIFVASKQPFAERAVSGPGRSTC
jgi:SAM-dependent methyltransferase